MNRSLSSVLMLLLVLLLGGQFGCSTPFDRVDPPAPKPDNTAPTNPVAGDPQPLVDSPPPVDNSQPPVDDSRPPIDDSQPPVDDSRPPICTTARSTSSPRSRASLVSRGDTCSLTSPIIRERPSRTFAWGSANCGRWPGIKKCR